MIDRVAARLGRRLYEVPVGFKWFVAGLLDGTLGFGGEESAGATFLRSDGTRLDHRQGRHRAGAAVRGDHRAHRAAIRASSTAILRAQLGEPAADRVEARATPEQKAVLAKLSPEQVTRTELAGEKIEQLLTRAPGNDAPIGGLKVVTQNGWFAARPSGTEDIYKIYAESFRGDDHLRAHSRRGAGDRRATRSRAADGSARAAPRRRAADEQAVEAWENEGDPN